MPNLADSKMCASFVAKLEIVERNKDSNLMSNWAREFIANLRESFEMRESQMDLGITPWNPSVKQFNMLSELAEKLK